MAGPKSRATPGGWSARKNACHRADEDYACSAVDQPVGYLASGAGFWLPQREPSKPFQVLDGRSA